MVIPSGWLQRLSKREVLSIIGISVALGSWIYSERHTNESLQSQITETRTVLTETRSELRAYMKEQDKRNEQNSVVLAVVSNSLTSIDKRLDSIETSVRRIAQ